MKQLNIYIENCDSAREMPSVVPVAYQAIMTLQDKINQAQTINLSTNSNIETIKSVDSMIPLWQRYSLSVPEAAKYFGIGEGRIYQIISEHPGAEFILEVGSHVKIKRVLFERYLDSSTCV